MPWLYRLVAKFPFKRLYVDARRFEPVVNRRTAAFADAHELRDGAIVHIVNHVIPYLCTFQLEDEQGVFLFV